MNVYAVYFCALFSTLHIKDFLVWLLIAVSPGNNNSECRFLFRYVYRFSLISLAHIAIGFGEPMICECVSGSYCEYRNNNPLHQYIFMFWWQGFVHSCDICVYFPMYYIYTLIHMCVCCVIVLRGKKQVERPKATLRRGQRPYYIYSTIQTKHNIDPKWQRFFVGFFFFRFLLLRKYYYAAIT